MRSFIVSNISVRQRILPLASLHVHRGIRERGDRLAPVEMRQAGRMIEVQVADDHMRERSGIDVDLGQGEGGINQQFNFFPGSLGLMGGGGSF